MTTSIQINGPYPVRVTTQERTNVNDEWRTTGSVEHPHANTAIHDYLTSTKRVIIEEYEPAPSEHDEDAEIARVAASNEEENAKNATTEDVVEEEETK